MPQSETILRIEKVTLKFQRPRFVGKNARKGDHGDTVKDPMVRVHTSSGLIGIGWSRIGEEAAASLIGQPLEALIDPATGCTEQGEPIDLALWDLVAKSQGLPLYQLLGARGAREIELYDGSIYIDDLGKSDDEAVEIFKEEVATGHAFSYNNFKIKIGRGARWMGVDEGLARDVLVIKTVREAAGPDAKILIDANNGTTLNIAKEILRRCEDVGIYWFEEAFPEDPEFNEAFKVFIDEQGYDTLVADGESGPPPPSYFKMVESGWIDIVQHDFRGKGLSWWRKTADRIAPWGAKCAPHCWGSLIERYTHAHFAASIPNFSMLEAAPADMPGIVLDGWEKKDGHLIVPDTPGIGFDIESDVLTTLLEAPDGFTVS
jgi:L-alanine-DL-glutamate epimerase-like enolase superfamily enzyme